MWHFDQKRQSSAVLLVLLALSCGVAHAQDMSLRIEESTFNDFGNRLQPIQITGQYALRTTIDLGIFGRHTITWCDSAYAGTVSGLNFDVTSSEIAIRGDVAVNWCGFGFGGPGPELTGSGDVFYNTADSTVRFTIDSANVRPTITAFGFVIRLPVTISVASMFSVPPFRLGSTDVSFETATGESWTRITPFNVAVTKQNGHIRLTSTLVMQ